MEYDVHFALIHDHCGHAEYSVHSEISLQQQVYHCHGQRHTEARHTVEFTEGGICLSEHHYFLVLYHKLKGCQSQQR